MQLFIPFEKFQATGGPTTFLSNFKNFLNKNAISFTQKFTEADLLFFPVQMDMNTLQQAYKMNKTIVQRLDGVYYPSQHGRIYKEWNKPIKTIYKKYASYIIFQSQYSKQQCFKVIGKKNENKYSIIHNGVDKSIFYPVSSKNKNITIRFISTGTFRKEIMLTPMINALDELRNEFTFELHLVGPIKLDTLNLLIKKPYIVYHGEKKMENLASLLRSADIFLHNQLNDNCPNAVIEAISCALPVVGFNSGAMSELCFFNQNLLAKTKHKLIHHKKHFDYQQFKIKIKEAVENYDYYKQNALNHAHLYNFNDCGKQYLNVFKKLYMNE